MDNLTAEQQQVAATILQVGKRLGASVKQIQAAFRAAWVESRFRNLTYGDRDSLGVFQQRPSQGWGSRNQILNVEYAAAKFFEGAQRVDQSGTPGQIAQRVQRSAFPDRYDQQAATPDGLLSRLSGMVLPDFITGAGNIGGVSAVGDVFGLGQVKDYFFGETIATGPERFSGFLKSQTISPQTRRLIATGIVIIIIAFVWREF